MTTLFVGIVKGDEAVYFDITTMPVVNSVEGRIGRACEYELAGETGEFVTWDNEIYYPPGPYDKNYVEQVLEIPDIRDPERAYKFAIACTPCGNDFFFEPVVLGGRIEIKNEKGFYALERFSQTHCAGAVFTGFAVRGHHWGHWAENNSTISHKVEFFRGSAKIPDTDLKVTVIPPQRPHIIVPPTEKQKAAVEKLVALSVYPTYSASFVFCDEFSTGTTLFNQKLAGHGEVAKGEFLPSFEIKKFRS